MEVVAVQLQITLKKLKKSLINIIYAFWILVDLYHPLIFYSFSSLLLMERLLEWMQQPSGTLGAFSAAEFHYFRGQTPFAFNWSASNPCGVGITFNRKGQINGEDKGGMD